MTGIALVFNFKIVGRLTPSGRLSYTKSTYERMSFNASSMLEPHSNSIVTIERLSFEVEYKSFKPSTELRAFSMILVTFVSISLALAPGYEVITVTYGGSISGSWSIGNFLYEKIPKITTATKMSAVVIGLFMAVL